MFLGYYISSEWASIKIIQYFLGFDYNNLLFLIHLRPLDIYILTLMHLEQSDHTLVRLRVVLQIQQYPLTEQSKGPKTGKI